MLPQRVPGRLLAANRHLSHKERQIREFLKLRVQPRLALLDEASATHITADDRSTLDREAQRSTASRRAKTPG